MNAHHYALVVGIGRYPGLSDLLAPVNDARAFHAWLTDGEGGNLPEENVEVVITPEDATAMTSSDTATPVKDQIDRALGSLHAKAIGAIDRDPDRWAASRLYLYVAGHGIMPDRSESTALLMANFDQQRDFLHNIDLGQYLAWYARCAPVSEVVAFADCCRSWKGSAEGMPPPFSRCGRPLATVKQMACYASAPDHVAYEETDENIPPAQRRGYFTRSLIAALKEAPVNEEAGGITSVTIAPYLKEAVRKATATRHSPQTVQVITDAASPILLASPPSRPPLHSVRLRFPDGYRGKVDLFQPSGAVQTWDVVNDEPAVLHLPPGYYAVFVSNTYQGTPFRNDGKFSVLSESARDGDGLDVQL